MTLRLSGDTSGFTEIKAADAAGDNSIKLPAANGGANQLLQNGGTAGELQYTSAGGGLHYDSDGRLLVGRSSAPDNDGALVIQGYAGVTAGEGTIQLLRGNNVTTTTQGLGTIDFGHDQHLGASIDAVSEAAWTEGLSHPTRLTFSTTATGSGAPTARVEIANSGELKLLAGCPGIDFSGIQPAAINSAVMTSETLDSYEEGTWTATSPVGTISSQSCTYTKIGRMVFLRGKAESFSDITNDAGIEIRGLPFAPSATHIDSTVGSVMYTRINDTDGIGPDLATYMTTLSVRFYFQSSDGDTHYAIVKHKDLTSNTSFRFSIQYNVD